MNLIDLVIAILVAIIGSLGAITISYFITIKVIKNEISNIGGNFFYGNGRDGFHVENKK